MDARDTAISVYVSHVEMKGKVGQLRTDVVSGIMQPSKHFLPMLIWELGKGTFVLTMDYFPMSVRPSAFLDTDDGQRHYRQCQLIIASVNIQNTESNHKIAKQFPILIFFSPNCLGATLNSETNTHTHTLSNMLTKRHQRWHPKSIVCSDCLL